MDFHPDRMLCARALMTLVVTCTTSSRISSGGGGDVVTIATNGHKNFVWK